MDNDAIWRNPNFLSAESVRRLEKNSSMDSFSKSESVRMSIKPIALASWINSFLRQVETWTPQAEINALISFKSIWWKLGLVDVAMACLEGGCLVMVREVLSVDV